MKPQQQADAAEPYLDDRDDELDEPECPRCHDDGCDPLTDYLMPCPLCQGEQQ